IDWMEMERSPHREMLALNQALIAQRKNNPCLSNCLKDLTEVCFSEEERWLMISRGDPFGGRAWIVCNFDQVRRSMPVPREAQGFKLALFTGEERFGGASETPVPPPGLDESVTALEIAPVSAALYLGQPTAGEPASEQDGWKLD